MREHLPVFVAGIVPFAVLVLIVVGTTMSLIAWQPPILQNIQFGTKNSQNGVTAIESDSTGVYASGSVGYSNSTPSYMFVNKYGLDGRQIWSQHFGDPYLSEIFSQSLGIDGVYIAGTLVSSSANHTSFVRKYDLNGNLIWNDQFFKNGPSTAMSVSVSGSSIYVGGFNGSTYFVRNYGPNGSLLWTQFLGRNNQQISVLAGSSGIFVAYSNSSEEGVIQGYNSNWEVQWTHFCLCNPMGMASDGTNIYFFGTVQRPSLPQAGLLTKYNFQGLQLWAENFIPPPGATGLAAINQVAGSADSLGIYLSGTTSDLRGIVSQYDSNGKNDFSLVLPWTTGIGHFPADVITTIGNSIYLGGDLEPGGSSSSTYFAFVTEISKASSLVFFGVNPPYSFGLLGLIVAVAVVSLLWLPRKRRNLHRRPTRGPIKPAVLSFQAMVPTRELT